MGAIIKEESPQQWDTSGPKSKVSGTMETTIESRAVPHPLGTSNQYVPGTVTNKLEPVEPLLQEYEAYIVSGWRVTAEPRHIRVSGPKFTPPNGPGGT